MLQCRFFGGRTRRFFFSSGGRIVTAAADPQNLILSLGVTVVGGGALGLLVLALRFGVEPSSNSGGLLPVEFLLSGMLISSSSGGKVKSNPRKSLTCKTHEINYI